MVDFNKKKRILKSLSKTAEKNILLLISCLIAAAFVKLYYFIVCNIDLALSDKNGNFLGVKRDGKERTSKARKQDDIVYKKRPAAARVVSAVLAVAFVAMFIPELEFVTFAAGTYGGYTCINDASGIFYNNSEYNEIAAMQPIITKMSEGNGTVKIYWNRLTLPSKNPPTAEVGYSLDGYVVSCFDSSGAFVNSQNLGAAITSCTFPTTVNLTSGAYTFEIYAKVKIPTYKEITDTASGTTNLDTVNYTASSYLMTTATFSQTSDTLNKTVDNVYINTIAYDESNRGVTFGWNAVTTTTTNGIKPAAGYLVYRSVVSSSGVAGNYTMIAATNGTTYTDKDVSHGFVYLYCVTAWYDTFEISTTYNASNKGNIYSNTYNTGADIKDIGINPNTATVEIKQPANTLVVEWSIVGGCSEFNIYRTTSNVDIDTYAAANNMSIHDALLAVCKSPIASKINYTGASKYTYTDTDESLTNGETYYYYVEPYLTQVSGKPTLYPPNSSGSSRTLRITVDKPQGFEAVPSDGTVSLKWNAVTGVDGYRVYFTKVKEADGTAIPANQQVTEYDDVKTSTYVHSSLYNGEMYTYQVRAFKNVKSVEDDTKTFSDYSVARTVTVGVLFNPPQDLVAKPGDGFIDLTWNQVAGATGYTVYAKKSGSNSWIVFDNISTNKFTHKGLINSDTWTYYVTAYKYVTQVRVDTDPSIEVTAQVGIPLLTPTDITATTTDGTAIVSWTAVNGAEGYIVYASSGGYTTQFDVTKNSFTHTNLTNGDVWKYYVVAYKTVTNSRFYSSPSNTVSVTIGATLDIPKDFNVVTTDGTATITWTAVTGATGYIIYASNGSKTLQFDVSKSPYVHTGLTNGETWSYYMVAYKTVSGNRTFSGITQTRTVQIGVSMATPADLTATAGNKQIDLKWSKVEGAEGYVVYLYDSSTLSFEPLTITSVTQYSHIGLKNGKTYTYMVAAYKTINGKKYYGDYSLPVSAVPTAGSLDDLDRELTVKGTTPYGISHSEIISAVANHDAFNESVDIYFSVSDESTAAVKSALKKYANGLSSFIIYPFDISCYLENTLIHVSPNFGYSVMITMPVPDKLIQYRDYISVVHIISDTDSDTIYGDDADVFGSDGRMEILPSAIIEVDNVWCIQFKATDFSPFAFVIYKDKIEDVSSGVFADLAGQTAGTFNSGVLMFTVLPDILPHNKKLKVVKSERKVYRIKK